MADEDGILNGSFKNFPISITGGSVNGGPKLSIKQFPNKDTQSIENLGLTPRSYSVDINVSAKTDTDYFGYRNNLLLILDSKGPGELIHPFYGRIENMVASPWTISESVDRFGDSILSVTFDPDTNTGIPQTAGNAVTDVQSLNAAITAAVQEDITENFSVDVQQIGNFEAAVDKVNGVIDAARESTAFIGEAADTLNETSALLGELAANVNSLVTDPLQLGLAIDSLFSSVNGLYASVTGTFETMTGFFNFGSDDTEIVITTAGLAERDNNNEVLNGSVAALALGYAYLAGTQLPFETTRDIDETASGLDDQYNLVQSGGADQSVKDAVTDMRITVLDVFDQARVNANQIIEVFTLPTTTRLLAYSYYGNDDLGQTITELNQISDVSFVEGTVEVLTA